MADSTWHISCQEVVELVTEYLEGAMADRDASLFEQHLNFCQGCIWYLDQLRVTVAATGGLGEADLPPQMRERLMVAFRDWSRS